MKHLVLVTFLSVIAVVRADTIVLTGTYQTTVQDDCGFPGCSPFSISIPQFDPSLGTLTSIAWTFTDGQQYYGGINDIGDPLIGDPFTWTTTEGDASSVLGLDVSNSQFNEGVNICGCNQISMGGWWSEDSLDATGVVPDDSPFIGTGTLNIPITPFVSASFPTSSNGEVEAGILFTEDSASLTVTETYTALDPTADPVPEPKGSIVALAPAFLLLVQLDARRRSGNAGPPTHI
jgi:hypothetical protein